MKINKFFKKGQALPLNTIVIAILVVIVLVVIIVFFTSSTGESLDTVKKNGATGCSTSNSALKTLGYKEVSLLEVGQSCSDYDGMSEIAGFSEKDENGQTKLCCGRN